MSASYPTGGYRRNGVLVLSHSQALSALMDAAREQKKRAKAAKKAERDKQRDKRG